jgi:hypothetical protein
VKRRVYEETGGKEEEKSGNFREVVQRKRINMERERENEL